MRACRTRWGEPANAGSPFPGCRHPSPGRARERCRPREEQHWREPCGHPLLAGRAPSQPRGLSQRWRWCCDLCPWAPVAYDSEWSDLPGLKWTPSPVWKWAPPPLLLPHVPTVGRIGARSGFSGRQSRRPETGFGCSTQHCGRGCRGG